MKLFRQQIQLACVFTLALGSSIVSFSQVQAQLAESVSNTLDNIRVRFNPPEPPDNGAPTGRQTGAGSQGLCQIGKRQTEVEPLIALVPKRPDESNKGKFKVWGLTTSPNPTFWFYVRYQTPAIAEFVLQNQAGEDIYRNAFPLSGTPGIVSIRLPHENPLELGQIYLWYFKIKCNREASSDDFVKGGVRRVSPNERSPALENQLKVATPLQRVALYAENGIWYDALTELAQLRIGDTNNEILQKNWAILLQSIDWEKLDREPIVPCCTSP